MDTDTATRSRTYFKAVEEILFEVEKSYPAGEANSGEMALVHCVVGEARRLARAFTRFPMFDTACLSRLKKQKIRIDDKHEIELWVPTFAWCSIMGSWGRTAEIYLEGFSGLSFSERKHISFDTSILSQNPRGVAQILRNNGQLRAAMPAIPIDVQRRVDKEKKNFDDIQLVWDAEWSPAPVGDPLVVGLIHGQCFLIDEFDCTKLERYVSSEFCQKAKEEGSR